jgi:hypothetical protein
MLPGPICDEGTSGHDPLAVISGMFEYGFRKLRADSVSAQRSRDFGMRNDEIIVDPPIGRKSLATSNRHYETIVLRLVSDGWIFRRHENAPSE